MEQTINYRLFDYFELEEAYAYLALLRHNQSQGDLSTQVIEEGIDFFGELSEKENNGELDIFEGMLFLDPVRSHVVEEYFDLIKRHKKEISKK